MPTVFLGQDVCLSREPSLPTLPKKVSLVNTERVWFSTSSWKQERVFEGGVICLFCSGGDASCPPGFPANNPKQVCAYTIWSLPPESEPREAPRWLDLPLALTGWGPWHLSVHPLSSLDPTIHTKPLLGVHLGPLALNSVPTTLKSKVGSEKLNVRASSCQLQSAA